MHVNIALPSIERKAPLRVESSILTSNKTQQLRTIRKNMTPYRGTLAISQSSRLNLAFSQNTGAYTPALVKSTTGSLITSVWGLVLCCIQNRHLQQQSILSYMLGHWMYIGEVHGC